MSPVTSGHSATRELSGLQLALAKWPCPAVITLPDLGCTKPGNVKLAEALRATLQVFDDFLSLAESDS